MKKIKPTKHILILFSLLIATTASASWPKYFNSTAANRWSQATRVVRTLGLQKGQAVADIGAGGGYFSVLLGRAVGPKGSVYAVDISTKSLDYINRYTKKHGLKNVITILAQPHDPGLQSKSVDLIFLRNTYHHISSRITYFRQLKRTLKPGAKVAIIDYHPHISIHHSTKESTLYREMKQAGYRLFKRFTFLKRQNFNIFVVR